MKKVKIGNLAKELKITAKELLASLKDLGIQAKTAASSIDDESAQLVRNLISGDSKPSKEKSEKKDANEEVKQVRKEIIKEVKPEPIEESLPQEPSEEIDTTKEIIFTSNEILVKDLADKFNIKAGELIKSLMLKGVMANINQIIDVGVAKLIAEENGFKVIIKRKEEEKYDKNLAVSSEKDVKNLVTRPPIVTILGHVDHGKTKLLDAIRSSNVVDGESGGITQHIGAYQVDIKGKKITFLDTPGHEAFTALRARGAKITDIAVLVIAADDGVKPQTIEALDHAKAAEVPIIVALNKIDKPDANPDRVKQQMAELGIAPEEWGGKTVTVPISAKQKQGIDELLEMILLVAEMQDLKANPKKPATGVVIEAELDKSRGSVATILIRNGTLRVGDVVSAGNVSGKIRALINDSGKRIKEAPPSTPVEILGLSSVPRPGDLIHVAKNERDARDLAAKQQEIQDKVYKGRLHSLEDFSKHIKEGEIKDLNLIIKSDVQGSLEAILDTLRTMGTAKTRIKLIHSAVGAINESDIMLAATTNAIIIGFHVDFEGSSKALADQEGISAQLYQIIYKLTEDVKLALDGLLEPEYEEYVLGHAEVRSLFSFSKVGVIAGCFVTDGKIIRGKMMRVFRGEEGIYEGKLESLKRFKDDVKEVAENFECGVAVVGNKNFKEGDRIECYEMRVKTQGK